MDLLLHRDDFWVGYDSFRRRVLRFGHIALPEYDVIAFRLESVSHDRARIAGENPNVARLRDVSTGAGTS